MSKRLLSCVLAFCMVLALVPAQVFAASEPGFAGTYSDADTSGTGKSISSNEIKIGEVGDTVTIPFTYGDIDGSAKPAAVSVSNSNVAVSIGDYSDADPDTAKLYVTGVAQGFAYVTLRFDGGKTATLKIIVKSEESESEELKGATVIELGKGDSKSVIVNLDKHATLNAVPVVDEDGNSVVDDSLNPVYEATSTPSAYATVTYDSDYVSVNKNSFTSSDILTITGDAKTADDKYAVVKVTYENGDKEVYKVYVGSTSKNDSYDATYTLDIGESVKHKITLSDYKSDYAYIVNDEGVDVNKDFFATSSDLVITGKESGVNYVKINFESGVVLKVKVVVTDNVLEEHKTPALSVSNIIVAKGDTESFYVYLGNTDRAVLTLTDSECATLSESTIDKDTRIVITGKTADTATTLRVVYSDGSRVVIPVYVESENYKAPTVTVETKNLKVDGTTTVKVFMGSKNSYATLTVDDPEKVSLDIKGYSSDKDTYTITSAKNSTVTYKLTGEKAVNETYLTVKFPEGRTIKVLLSVGKTTDSTSTENKTDENKTDENKTETPSTSTSLAGLGKDGKNLTLKAGLTVNNNMLTNGYINGYSDGTFKPNDSITREEFGVILARLLNPAREVASTDYFQDVTSDWSKEQIASLHAMGAVTTSGSYRPTAYITRYEVAEMLYNVLDLSNYSTYCPLSDIGSSDLDQKMAKCYNAGLIKGYPDGTFGGYKTMTRAEIVTMMNRMFYASSVSYKNNPFSDVSTTFWAYQDILKAAQN